ncbi:MAG: Lrp/AsnC ligand binding domain-containing protein [Candidatus Bathyarchaeia archaeon]
MVDAYVLINTEIGAEDEVMEALDEIEEVKESYLVYGVYDVIVKLSTGARQDLKDVVMREIRRIDKIRSTLTMMVVESP